MKRTEEKQGTLRWDKLDNTAHVFPVIAGNEMTNVYRISVVLKEEVQQDLLQQALDIVLPKFEIFHVRLRQGIFWYYFEENVKRAPRVHEEETYPCRYIVQNKNRSYLFRVTYYKKRINLEVFHVLTDGMGGINFLRELTYQYLRLAHPKLREQVGGDALCSETSLNTEDSFIKNYRKSSQKIYKTQKAYLLKGEKFKEPEFGVIHGYLNIPQLKSVCKKMGASINEYLVSVFIWSIYTEYMHGMPEKRPVRDTLERFDAAEKSTFRSTGLSSPASSRRILRKSTSPLPCIWRKSSVCRSASKRKVFVQLFHSLL